MNYSNKLYDAILIPGGGVRENYELPLWTIKRLERAIQCYESKFLITLSAGTTHKSPPLSSDGYPIFESVAAAKYLLDRGVNPDIILLETSSYDTIGNAYFSKVIHIDPLGLTNLLIITSEFHLPRTKTIFEWIYSAKFSSKAYQLTFDGVSDEGIDESILTERIAKEKNNLNLLKEIMKEIKDLSQLHRWLFTQHSAYSVAWNHKKNTGDAFNTY